MEESYSRLFAQWEISVTKALVRDFQRRYPWLKMDFDDLLEKCLIHWHHARTKFDAQKAASARSYMVVVIKNKLNSILKEELSDKRKLDHFAGSLDQLADEEEAMPGEVISDSKPSLEDEVFLRVDVKRVVSELGPFQQRVCNLLSQGYSIRDIAGIVGKSKSAIHRQVSEIRHLFADKRLDDYLR